MKTTQEQNVELTELEEKTYELMVNDFERNYLTGDDFNMMISDQLGVTRKQATGIVGSLCKKGFLKKIPGEVNGRKITQYAFPKAN